MVFKEFLINLACLSQEKKLIFFTQQLNNQEQFILLKFMILIF